MYPELTPTGKLLTGQVGYIITGMRNVKEAMIGDTFFVKNYPVQALPGFTEPKPMVFAGIYPVDNSEYEHVRDAIAKLTLNDPSVFVEKETSVALGHGFRCGFLGLLHMDVFVQRLEQEYDVSIISTAPSVLYEVLLTSGKRIKVDNPADFPDPATIDEIFEPMVKASIIAPDKYLGSIINLCQEKRGVQINLSYIGEGRVLLGYNLPLCEIVTNFYDKLKSISAGYASLDYEASGFAASDMVKMDILLNGQPVDALSIVIHRDKAFYRGRALVERLKGVIPRQMFALPIQAAIGSKVLARETISAYRKDVIAKCYGGDITRKRKLLDKQKEGKKKMKMVGTVELSQETFLAVLKDDE
jgi:GTP-binding protein LepA